MIRPELRPMSWQAELEPGEVLLWQGRAVPSWGQVAPDRAEWLIGGVGAVVVAILAVLRYRLALGDGAALVGLAALFAALFAAGYPFRQIHQRSRAIKSRHYALTDRRVLIAAGRPRAITRAARNGHPPRLRLEGDLGTLIVPIRKGAPVELPHIAHPQAVLKVISAISATPSKGRTA